jgi:hypothetical protein
MIVRDATTHYVDCPFCKTSTCISSYQPRLFDSLETLSKAVAKTCFKCGRPLGIESLRVKLISKE